MPSSYAELLRLAQTPGPMQDLALRSLMEEYDTDDRVERIGRHGSEQFDPQRYLQAYYDELGDPARHEKVYDPDSGTWGPTPGDMPYEDWRQSAAVRDVSSDLEKIYDQPWYEDAWDMAKSAGEYLTTPEGIQKAVETGRDTFAPIYSQLDSENWAKEGLDNYFAMRDYDPLGALMYLPQVALGTAGMIPGVSGMVGGGRKLGKGAQLVLEGSF